MQVYPFKLRAIYKQRIWGGQKLREFFGKEIPEGEKIGESWELADLPEDKSVIANGELEGQTLAGAIEKYPEEITGDRRFRGLFPLLIKFLDAEDILSVQVHPDPPTCKRMGKGDPKTECWYIVRAEEGAVIYKGLKEGVTKESFAEAIEKGTVGGLLAEVPVATGECHFLPAGTAHTIGGGLLIAEIQTPSDTTYRVFDWNRVDDTGKLRPLHIEEALESIHFDASGDELSVTKIGRLVDCEYFKIDKGHEAKRTEMLLSAGRMKTLLFLNCVLVPAAYKGAAQFEEETEYLAITI
ncbi:MAG: type I phosphomannose isomerase catalytic subunit [Planctomycetota bacterium]|jgi:mannose-6-phosphate isomerase